MKPGLQTQVYPIHSLFGSPLQFNGQRVSIRKKTKYYFFFIPLIEINNHLPHLRV
jgi:hypothetical protein